METFQIMECCEIELENIPMAWKSTRHILFKKTTIQVFKLWIPLVREAHADVGWLHSSGTGLSLQGRMLRFLF